MSSYDFDKSGLFTYLGNISNNIKQSHIQAARVVKYWGSLTNAQKDAIAGVTGSGTDREIADNAIAQLDKQVKLANNQTTLPTADDLFFWLDKITKIY